jgi:restriction system protein
MSIPDYQKIMLPLLKYSSDGVEHSFREAVEKMATFFEISEDERSELLPSGKQPIFDNRVGWAKTYLTKAHLLELPKRGHLIITKRGINLLKKPPLEITSKFLEQFEEFKKFTTQKKEPQIDNSHPAILSNSDLTPDDILAKTYNELKESIEFEVLEQVKSITPMFFEQLVIDLLVSMGYGGNRQDAARAVGKSGDGGIDGIINEDRLGLDVIYVQAKRWDNIVGRPEIQKFAGALEGQRARKGIFITTSSFTKEAIDFAKNIEKKIILIDGKGLSKLMVEHNIGVSVIGTYEIKKLDLDYFEGV